MIERVAGEPAVNEAAERLRYVIRKGMGWPDEHLNLLESALDAERRNTVERIREKVAALEREARRMTGTIDGPSANHHTGREYAFREVSRILDEVAS